MAGRIFSFRKYLGAFILLLLLGGGVAWVERSTLLAWFYVRQLAHATESTRDTYVHRVADLGEAAVPGLLDCLTHADPPVCANARAGLAYLAEQWGPGDSRRVEMALYMARTLGQMSPAGQQNSLELTAHWFVDPRTESTDGLLSACAQMVEGAASVTEPEVQGAALELCAALLGQPQGAEALRAARPLIRAGLQSSAPATRLRAIQLALHPGVDLLEPVVALLTDGAADVRRAAMLAVGPANQVVREECLLPSLHDPDPEVRRLCEAALHGRGLGPEHVQLARLLTDPNPVIRLQVLDQLRQAGDLDPGVWLRRLSHDPSPAVRVAAMRAMSQQTLLNLNDRIDQMARTDPSPTVRQLAQYYLTTSGAAPRSTGAERPKAEG
jgi:hypothetical protein